MNKFFTTSFKTKSEESEDRTITFVATKEVVDRDGEIITIKGIDIKNFKRNPVILWAHERAGLPIGKAVDVKKKQDGEMHVKVQFAEPEVYAFADTVYKLVKGGYLNAVSIGFIPDFNAIRRDEKTGTRIYDKTEMFELSVVPIPANQEALVLGKAMKDGIIDDVEAKEWKLYCEKALETQEEDKITQIEERLTVLEASLNTQKSYLETLFDTKQDTSAQAKDGQTDEYSEEDMQEIMDYFEYNNEEKE